MFFKKNKPRTAKLIFAILLCMILSALTGAYYIERLTSGDTIINDIKIDSEAALVLNLMKHTSSRNGLREWTLEADSARLLKNQENALLTKITAIFFLEDGETVHATANEGSMNTVTHDIVFSGKVRLKYMENILKTEQLHYEKKSHIIYSNEKVTITNKTSVLEADTLNFDLTRNSVLLKGHVNAQFSEAPQW